MVFLCQNGRCDFQCTYCASDCDFGHVTKCHKLQADFHSQSDLCTVSHASKNSPSCESSSMLTTNPCKHLQYHILVSQSGDKGSYPSPKFLFTKFCGRVS